MRITVNLPEPLVITARKRAAQDQTTLKKLIECGLRRELEETRSQSRRRRPLRFVVAPGGLPRALPVADRALMHDNLRDERSR